MLKSIRAGVLEIAYRESGDPRGWPIILSHGFPYDIHAYEEVAPQLAAQGAHVIMPYLRGFGPTRFLSPETPRSGQQAALGSDLLSMLDALGIKKAILAGYDWGGLASCVVAALWPERVSGLVSLASYDILDLNQAREPLPPGLEHTLWYQHLFQTERGKACLRSNTRELCRMLWEQWSPHWRFDDATFNRTAESYENQDFVDIVSHHYGFALGEADSDPAYEELEAHLATRPKIKAMAVTLDGASDALKPGGTAEQAVMFTGKHEHRVVMVGHNVPQEAPGDFVDACLTVRRWLVEDRQRQL